MLINATQHEELRIALVQDEKLYDLYVERIGFEQKKANIYKGKIARVEPSLGAAFVDYGSERHGFLPLKEIAKEYYQTKPKDDKTQEQPDIKDAVHQGQEIMVQIEKEERGNKGAALTTYISLAGSYLVLMPNNPKAGGISRRIDGQEREELRDTLNKLTSPQDMGVIVRTAGVGKTEEELQWDLDALLNHWETIKKASQERSAPFLIHKESDEIIRAMRDHLKQDIDEILIDSPEIFEKVTAYIQQTRPDFLNRIKLYQDAVPLFSRYRIEKQIETAYQRKVTLASGGSIVIDHTEALVSIDVNSARSTGGSDIEETAFHTNLEAADEIARQLRLRDIGGLIVIDFIDMSSNQNQRKVAAHLREALQHDRARIRTGNITRFGLMEMSRQRIRARLGESTQVTCPRCNGQGVIRSIGSLSLSLIRILEEEATSEKIAQLNVQLPMDLATYLLNEKHDAISEIEVRHEIRIVLVPNQYLQTPNYKIRKLKKSDLPRRNHQVESYKLIETPKIEPPLNNQKVNTRKPEEPAVQAMVHKKPSPYKKPGLIKRLLGSITATKPKQQPEKKTYNQNRSTSSNRNRSYNKKPYNSSNRNRRPSSSNRSHSNNSASSNTRRGTRGGQNRSKTS